MKIQDRLRTLFRRTATSPRFNAQSIGDTINRELGRGGLLQDVDIPQAGAPSPAVRPRMAPPTAMPKSHFAARTYSCPSGSLDYKLFIPSTFSAAPSPRPGLIVMLHGCHQSADDTAAGTCMNELAEQHGFLVAYPQQASRSNASKCWNWFRPEDQKRDRGEPALIAGITNEVCEEFVIDRERVFAAGLSAGGAMAVIMAATYPDVYSAIGVHSGLAFRAAHDVVSAFSVMRDGRNPHAPTPPGHSRVVPTIVFHGDHDQTVSVRNSEAIVARVLASYGAEPSILRSNAGEAGGRCYTRAVYTDETHRDFLETWIVHDAGHAWSGGSPHGSHTDRAGPDASAEMVRFFFSH